MNTFAAIDIGSNGARLLIKRFNPEAVREEDRIKKVMFIRIPLRLGKDVFSLGKISKEREKMMLRMMKGFKQFMKLNDVDEYRACATSAMRDAENGKKILKKIEKQTDIKSKSSRARKRPSCSSTTYWRRRAATRATSPTSTWAVALPRYRSSTMACSPRATPTTWEPSVCSAAR